MLPSAPPIPEAGGAYPGLPCSPRWPPLFETCAVPTMVVVVPTMAVPTMVGDPITLTALDKVQPY